MSVEFWVGPHDNPDRIRLGPVVGSGAEGVLYRAYLERPHQTLDVAVKMLQPGHLQDLAGWTTRWREQVELLGRIDLPGLVQSLGGFVGPLPHGPGRADLSTSSLYLVMAWVEGISLDRWIGAEDSPAPADALLALTPVAEALDTLNSGGATAGVPVVHGDVKPANILVRDDGTAVLVDLGGVRRLNGAPSHDGLLGTPGYMAPEASHGEVSGASDRYSFGAVAAFVVTRREPPAQPEGVELDTYLDLASALAGRDTAVHLLLAAINADPGARPLALVSWVRQLSEAMAERPSGALRSLRSPARRIAAAVAALVFLALGAALLSREDQRKGRPSEVAAEALAVVAPTAVSAAPQATAAQPKPAVEQGPPSSISTVAAAPAITTTTAVASTTTSPAPVTLPPTSVLKATASVGELFVAPSIGPAGAVFTVTGTECPTGYLHSHERFDPNGERVGGGSGNVSPAGVWRFRFVVSETVPRGTYVVQGSCVNESNGDSVAYPMASFMVQ